MKIVFTQEEVEDLINKATVSLAPSGTKPTVKIERYSSEQYATVEFVVLEPTTATEATVAKEITTTTAEDDKPIDLSEIPF